MRDIGGLLIVIGMAVVVLGLLARAGLLGWVGRLPGDIRIETESTRVFIPITTSIIGSVVLTLLLYLFRR